MIQVIRSTQDSGEQAIDYLMIAKYFEKIGDHAVNISQWVLFMITGAHEEDTVHDLLVEDDPNIRELEVYTLQSVGFKALGIGSGDECSKRWNAASRL